MKRQGSLSGWKNVAFVLASVTPAPASATVLAERSLEAIAREADVVIVATPAARSSFWRSGRIVTDVTVAIEAVVAGRVEGPASLTVRLPGGSVGVVGMAVAGAPALDAGVPVVLFLSAPRDGARTLVTLAASVLHMTSTRAGVVVLPARNDGLATPHDRGSAPPSRLAAPVEGLALGAFVARVREARR